MSTNKLFCLAFILYSTTACSSDMFITHNGNMPINERITQVETGQNKTQVQDILGAPSNVASFDENTWIYMSSDIKKVAFFKPEEVNRDVLTIRFNNRDEVAEITRLTKVDGKEVSIDSNATPTLGHRPGFFSRFFGGVGQYVPLGNSKGLSDY